MKNATDIIQSNFVDTLWLYRIYSPKFECDIFITVYIGCLRDHKNNIVWELITSLGYFNEVKSQRQSH